MKAFDVRRMVLAIVLLLAACSSPDAPADRPDDRNGPDRAAEPEREPTPVDGTYASGEYILQLDAGRWSVNFPPREGDFRLNGDQLVLYNEDGCPGEGTYDWTFEDDELVLTKVQDLCVARNVRFPSVWKWSAAATFGESIDRGDPIVLSDGEHVGNYMGDEDVTGRSEATIDVMTTSRFGLVLSPTILVGSPGQTLTITLRNPETQNTENQQHNFNIDELGVSHVELPYGGEETVTVTLPESGALRFYCDYHYRFGQQGEFLID